MILKKIILFFIFLINFQLQIHCKHQTETESVTIGCDNEKCKCINCKCVNCSCE